MVETTAEIKMEEKVDINNVIRGGDDVTIALLGWINVYTVRYGLLDILFVAVLYLLMKLFLAFPPLLLYGLPSKLCVVLLQRNLNNICVL